MHELRPGITSGSLSGSEEGFGVSDPRFPIMVGVRLILV